MKRLTLYLLKVFSGEALALFAVALFLLFLIQCLRIIDVISSKGQTIFTLIGQALLGMPALAVVFLYACLGIGLGRALLRLQSTNELQVIHTNRLVPRLMHAVFAYGVFGAIAVLALTNFIEPVANRQLSLWSTAIAADLVSTTLTPHKFSEVSPGVTLVIGGRLNDGQVSEFFADDRRTAGSRRTYIAKTAVITEDDQGYVLQLNDGAVQYLTTEGQFSEISFHRYDLALDRLTGGTDTANGLAETNSLDIIVQSLRSGTWSDDVVRLLARRMGEAVRIIAMVLFVAALAAFPDGKRRRFNLPIELVALAAAFIERGVGSYLPAPALLAPASGALLLLGLSLLVLAFRLRIFAPVQRRLRPA